MVRLIGLIIALSSSLNSYAQVNLPTLAFSEAKGFGKYSQGGKQGKLYIINSLADDAKNPAEGTLRYAIKQKHARTIVFAVSGVIKLSAPLKISRSYITIAGQSSPGGITLAGAPVSISKAKHVIIRHLRFRLGTFGYADDALSVRNSEQVIIDHCSFSWSVDEAASFYNNRNFTLQNSIIANSLNNSIHPKGKHGYGGIWGGANASFINNIIANHASRTPRINGHRLNPSYPQAEEFVEIANNIIFNWGHNNVYGSENGRFNLVNNYYKAGAASKINQLADIWYSPLIAKDQAYIHGNFLVDHHDISEHNWLGVNYRTSKKAKRTLSSENSQWLSQTILTPIDKTQLIYQPTSSAVDTFTQAINNRNIGANKNAHGRYLDSVDSEVYQQLQQPSVKRKDQNTQELISNELINHEKDQITSWSAYEQQFLRFPKILDSNKDGIDDLWLNKQTLAQQKSADNAENNDLLNRYLASLAQ